MIDPLLVRAIAIACALLLLFSAWHKLVARDSFIVALGDYQLLPAALLRPAAVLIPVFEAVLGVTWLAGYEPRVVALLTAALLALYAAAIAINLWRGRVHISCGCGFGGASGTDQQLSWWLVARNVLLGAVAVLAALPAASRELGLYDWLTVVLALAACGTLYAGASQLLRNGAAISSWRRLRD
jgi:hypothetical protein